MSSDPDTSFSLIRNKAAKAAKATKAANGGYQTWGGTGRDRVGDGTGKASKRQRTPVKSAYQSNGGQ